jgi:3'(2'), 5'-bisphosphate nucleotidase
LSWAYCRAAQQAITASLATDRPGDLVFSEEAVADARRLSAVRVWIVDPLDGTNEYGEGRPDWAVHVALWAHGDLVAGAVALPAVAGLLRRLCDRPAREPVDRTKLTWGTGDATLAGPAAPSPPTGRLVASRTRAPEFLDEVGRELGLEVVALGSAGAKIMAVVLGHVDAYVHAGGQYEWDSAAPVAVARQHGLHTSRIDGSPLAYNQPDPLLPDIVVCRAELAEPLLAAVARATARR